MYLQFLSFTNLNDREDKNLSDFYHISTIVINFYSL